MSHTLFEINEFIRRVIALNLPEALWIRSELADVKVSKGHYYLDLVQKSEGSEAIIAQAQAVIWSKNYRSLQKKIGADLPALLQPGMEILFLAKPEFHERFGLKLMVEDIDPAHTLGKLEMQRRETIRMLQSQNLLQKNGELPLTMVVQRLAVLSSERAAGFQDFVKHLTGNSFGYQFKIDFFQVAVQGVLVEKEVVGQLESLSRRQADYDAVVIIRGGGAKLDLAAFDSFLLAKTVANMPLPVLTGIGHDVDETVLDLVAHSSLKTPTAVADFIIHRNLQFESLVVNCAAEVKNLASNEVKNQSNKLQLLAQQLDYQLKNNFFKQSQMLDYIERELPAILKNKFSNAETQLLNFEKIIQLLDPETALKRGFAMVYFNEKQLSDSAMLNEGDSVKVRLKKGSFSASVKTIDQ